MSAERELPPMRRRGGGMMLVEVDGWEEMKWAKTEWI
jgi:hypothetical protein